MPSEPRGQPWVGPAPSGRRSAGQPAGEWATGEQQGSGLQGKMCPARLYPHRSSLLFLVCTHKAEVAGTSLHFGMVVHSSLRKDILKSTCETKQEGKCKPSPHQKKALIVNVNCSRERAILLRSTKYNIQVGRAFTDF